MHTSQKPGILLSAYSFAPRQGSESGTGWATALTLSQEYRVTVICAAHYRTRFEDADIDWLRERDIAVDFFKAERHAWMLKLPLGGIQNRLYYYFWQKSVSMPARRHISESHPVAVQHVNWGTGKVPSGIVGLGVPTIFGPIGGFERGHPQVSAGLGGKLRISEHLRRLHIRLSRHHPALRAMYRKIDLVLACTEESATHIRTLGARRVELMTNAGVSSETATHLANCAVNKTVESKFRLLFASRLCGWKGEELAIRSLAGANDPNIHLTILGSGSNAQRCKRMARRLGVDRQISFVPFLPEWKDVWELYESTDVFLFPSLHDSGGTAVLEAMAAGLPVICLDMGGPSRFITDCCGIRIPPGPTAQVVHQMTNEIIRLRDDSELRMTLGHEATTRCLNHFTWESRGRDLLDKVRSVWKDK